MSTEESNEDLCRCCHSEGSYKSLYTPYVWLDEAIVYSNVLQECFNIELLEVRKPLQHMLCAICYTCIQRLEDALKFKRQIQKCEKRFQDVYSGCVNKDSTVTIKIEKMDTEDNILFESASCDNGAMRYASRVADDGENSDDEIDSHSDDEDYFSKETKVVKCGETNTSLGQVRKETVENKPKSVQDEEELETIEGMKVVNHLVKRGVDYMVTDDGFQCLKCPRILNNINTTRYHVRYIHLNIPKYKCSSCSKILPTLVTFTKHKLEEHGIDDRFKCNACNSAFNTKIQLKTHINSFHMLGEKMKCKECGFETYNKHSLHRHETNHSPEKNFQCKYCKKAFKRRSTMRYHERIHTGDRRKVCTECGQAFVQRASLKYHMIKHHPGVDF